MVRTNSAVRLPTARGRTTPFLDLEPASAGSDACDATIPSARIVTLDTVAALASLVKLHPASVAVTDPLATRLEPAGVGGERPDLLGARSKPVADDRSVGLHVSDYAIALATTRSSGASRLVASAGARFRPDRERSGPRSIVLHVVR
jgi:hypothetical protein